jgi:anti-sigma B factor antagonist
VRFAVNSVLVGDVAILCCRGNLGCEEAIMLSDAVAPLLSQKRAVILNFAGVEGVDSGGLGTLVLLHMYAHSSGGRLRFCSLNGHVRELVKLTRVDTLFEIYPTEQQARNAVPAALAPHIYQ